MLNNIEMVLRGMTAIFLIALMFIFPIGLAIKLVTWLLF